MNSVRIVSRQTTFPQNNELIRVNAENLRLKLQLDSLTKQNAELLQTISAQSLKIDLQAWTHYPWILTTRSHTVYPRYLKRII